MRFGYERTVRRSYEIKKNLRIYGHWRSVRFYGDGNFFWNVYVLGRLCLVNEIEVLRN